MRSLMYLCVVSILALVAADAVAAWPIMQLTDNDYDDTMPQVSGNNVAWAGESDSDENLFLYDGVVRQLTNSSNLCINGKFSLDGNRVAWTARDKENGGREVFFFDGQTTRQITNNDMFESSPIVWNGGVAWLNRGFRTDDEIFNYDGTSIVQLTDDDHRQYSLSASGNYVGWVTNDDSVCHVMRYDGQTVTEVTNTADNHLVEIQFSEKNVLLAFARSLYYPGYAELAICTPEGIEELATISASQFQLVFSMYSDWDISGSCVVWASQGVLRSSTDVSISPDGVYFYDGDQIIQLADRGSNPCVSDSFVAWSASDGNDSEIFLYDGTSIMQVTDNDSKDFFPQISGSTLAWQHWDGNDWEIQMTTVPEPGCIVLGLTLLLGFAAWCAMALRINS